MSKTTLIIATLSLTAFAFAGCVEDAGTPDLDALAGGGVADADPLIFAGTGCTEAGGVSTYIRNEGDTVGPFETENTAPHIGDPVIGTWVGGTPGYTMATGDARGIWHMAVKCPTYTVDGEERPGMDFGWVAYMIKQPEIDTSTNVDKHFLVADLSISDAQIVEQLQVATGGAEISRSFGATIERVGDNVVRAYLDDEFHGVFGSDMVLEPEPFGTKTDEVIRFWMLVPVGAAHGHDEGGIIPAREAGEDAVMYRPVAFDLIDTGGSDRYDGPAAFTHTDNTNHGNAVGAGGNVHGVYWESFDREFRWAPVPQVLYETTWTH